METNICSVSISVVNLIYNDDFTPYRNSALISFEHKLTNTTSILPTVQRIIIIYSHRRCRCRWPHGLRRRSAAARLLGLWVLISPGAWMFVCCVCCVLSGRGLFDELITRPEESYWLWCVVVCDLETSWMRRPWPTGGCRSNKKQTNKVPQTLSNCEYRKHQLSVIKGNLTLE